MGDRVLTRFAALAASGIILAGAAPDLFAQEPSVRAEVSGEPLAGKPVVARPYMELASLVNPGAEPVDVTRSRAGERAVVCGPLAFPEGEPNCGLGPDGLPNDTLNGGCSSATQFFSPTFCGDVICGTSAWNGVARDTDWYEITIFSRQSLTWEVTAEFDAIIGLAGGTNGTPDCQLVTGITPFRLVPAEQTDSVTVCLPPGTWWFVVLPDLNQVPFGCGAVYEASLTCNPSCEVGGCCFDGLCDDGYILNDCVAAGGTYLGEGVTCPMSTCAPPPNDDCVDATSITLGTTVVADLRNATLESQDELPPCAVNGGVASVWFKFVGNGEMVRISTCDSEQNDPNATDSIIGFWSGTCANPVFQLCEDDSGCGGTGRLTDMCTFATQLGTTHYIQVLAWSESTRGQYLLETSFPCTAPDPTGACCIPTTFGPFCDEIEESSCVNDFDGVFQGSGTACASADCTGVEIPPNDGCFDAILLNVPDSHLGDTTFATEEGAINDCGLPIQSPGLWYVVQGTGNTMTADLCSGNTLFDARLHVYCNNCSSGAWTCVAANDDALDVGCGTRPAVSWCSEPGAFYYILVSGTNGEEGIYEISVDDDGVACPNPASCDPNCAVSCPPGATSEGEPGCQPNYVDVTNGGCGSDPPVYGQIQPGEAVCGTSGTYALGAARGRDIDWFRFSLQQQCDVTWTVQADFLVETFILTDECGAGLFSFAESAGNTCQDVIVQTTLEPGDYTLLVQPQFFFGVDCGSDAWTGTLDCVPTANNGACCLDAQMCIETTQQHCVELGGGFGQAGQSCAEVICQAPPPCPADLDGNGVVDVLDFSIFAPAFGTSVGDPGYVPEADFDGNGTIDVLDFGAFIVDFGMACPRGAER